MGRILGLAAVLVLLVSCGSEQVRPVLLSTEPADREVVSGAVHQIRLEYDSVVSILNPAQLAVSVNGIVVVMDVWVDSANPTVVIGAPLDGVPLGPGWIQVSVAQGLVVNEAQHYTLDLISYGFHANPASATLRLPQPSAPVVAVTPPLEEPAPCHWFQLASSAGTGTALAASTQDELDLEAVALTHTPGGDLVARAPALVVSPDGRVVFAAFQDVLAQRVRLCRVDALTREESGTCLLSATASPGTHPLSLTLVEDGRRIRVRCRTNHGTEIVEVDAATLQELAPSGR